MKWALRNGWRCAAHGAAVVFTAGLALRLTVRDGFDGFAVIFYATPLPVLAVLAAMVALFWRRRRRLVAYTFTIAALACGTAWLLRDVRFYTASKVAPQFRVSYWNIARPGWRVGGILDRSTFWNAELMGFGECKVGGDLQPRWRDQLAPRVITELRREMFVAAPGPAELVESGSLGGAGEYELRRVSLGGRSVLVLMVDFDGEVLRPRRPAFEKLYELVEARVADPLILMGDFNTPSDSAFFDRLHAKMRDTFDEAGSGHRATWPMLLPVLSLDHIWVSAHFRVICCQHETSPYSDHRAVVVDLAWREPWRK